MDICTKKKIFLRSSPKHKDCSFIVIECSLFIPFIAAWAIAFLWERIKFNVIFSNNLKCWSCFSPYISSYYSIKFWGDVSSEVDNIKKKKSNILFTRWTKEDLWILLTKPIPLFHRESQIWGDFKFSFEGIVSIIICWFSFVAKWTILWSWLSLLKWKSWWIMAHFPYYALSSSLEMMHGLKLTKQKTKSSIGSFSFLQIVLTCGIKSSCCTCCTQWPPLMGKLNSHWGCSSPAMRTQKSLLQNVKGISYPKTSAPHCHYLILVSFWQGMHMPRSFSYFYNVKCGEMWICSGK